MFPIFREGFRVTQKFGNKHPYFGGRVHKNFYAQYGSKGGHNGIDLVPKVVGDNIIFLPIDAKIIYLAKDYSNGYGAYVKVEFTYKMKRYYMYFCHLDEWFDALKPYEGTHKILKAGSAIGKMGGSGNGKRHAFAPHLHFGVKPVEVQKKDKKFAYYVNPNEFVC